ncbi:TAT-variant-translocated molybdopterin oxidoreductase [Haloferula sargassicola]|uniref:4Fe-4S ferredoxin-type domain-containing protein n=1 Tax=Haloferula sargassicola TaxID=490096 RepID=A0ABP9UGR5_9BACT
MSSLPPPPIDLPERYLARLSGKHGPALWRTLDELFHSPGFRDEFPSGAADWPSDTSRRSFLKLAAASLSLAGLTGCQPHKRRDIAPYVRAPEEALPGVPSYYASSISFRGYGRGIVVRSNDGRPTKIEGNPDHPSSLGATDAVTQAAILALYDPDRCTAPLHGNRPTTWSAFAAAWRNEIKKHPQGEGIHLVLAPTTSPTTIRQLDQIREKLPRATIHFHDPYPRLPRYLDDFSQPDVIVSIGQDFLTDHPDALRHTREFTSRRAPENPNRLHVVESCPSVTGSMADHHWPVAPSRLADFLAHPPQPLAEALNAPAALILGAPGGRARTVLPPIRSDELAPPPPSWIDALHAGEPESLVFLGINPIHEVPGLSAQTLQTVPFTAAWSLHPDETATACQWQLPATHFLEHWSDLRAWDGTASIVQPLIEPFYQGRSLHQLLALFAGDADWETNGPNRVQQTWNLDEPAWRSALRSGIIPNTALRPTDTTVSPPEIPARSDGLDLILAPDPYLGFGEHANNPWLRELPRPLTTLTWTNAFLLSPALAKKHELESGDLIRVRIHETSAEGPVLIQPGHADDCLTAHLGYGRKLGGALVADSGFDVTGFLATSRRGATIEKLGRRIELPVTQRHQTMHGRPLVLAATYDEFRSKPEFIAHEAEKPERDETLYPLKEPDRYEWGMSIDLNTCIGCNACVTACQAENNIPTVGRDQVIKGREMHWIRLDRYYAGDPAHPSFLHQPVPCMHCEHAPCEVVCPVAATAHSHDGLNQMVYNRCVGTRYCSNNCPYKVRRFNFLDYHPQRTKREPFALAFNPDVTVRSRGVMEKCTYCVQRINRAKQTASIEKRDVRDGEIVTACQQVCPAQAIRFGNVADPNSEVSRSKASPRDYPLLASENTRPRTTYGARLIHHSPDAV